jgi:catechol 2,3-dioxygenase-like lactoylglutathione lyase family enzyme
MRDQNETNQVTVPSADIVRSIEFYNRLGLIQIVHSPPGYARFVCPDGDATFSIHHTDDLSAGAGPVVYFECDNLDETVAELKRRGFEFDSDPVDQPWLWREAYLRDPDGNVICLFFAGENRLNPPWRMKT